MNFDDALHNFRATFATIPASAPIGPIDGFDFDGDDLDPEHVEAVRAYKREIRDGSTP